MAILSKELLKMEKEGKSAMKKSKFLKVSDRVYIRLEKASATHKYIKRLPHPSGKGYIYFYNQQQIKDYKKSGTIPGDKPKKEEPRSDKSTMLESLLSFFGVGKRSEAIDKAYDLLEKNKATLKGVDKNEFVDYLDEYLSNKELWDKRLSKEPKAKSTEKKEPTEKKEKKETVKKSGKSWNLSLMRKVAGIVGGVVYKVEEKKEGGEEPKIKKDIQDILNKYKISIAIFNPRTKEKGEFLQTNDKVDSKDSDFITKNKDKIIKSIKMLEKEKKEQKEILEKNKKKEAEKQKVNSVKINNHTSDGVSISFDGVDNGYLRDDYKNLLKELRGNWNFYKEKVEDYFKHLSE
jgi:hypothetical protein